MSQSHHQFTDTREQNKIKEIVFNTHHQITKQERYNEMKTKKIIFLGGGYVGKRSIATWFGTHHFPCEWDPFCYWDPLSTYIEIDGTNYRMEINVVNPNDKDAAWRETLIRSGDGFVIVYSITSTTSFLETVGFRQDIYRVLNKDDLDHIPILLVGNKCDLESERQVSKEDAERLCNIWGIEHIECSVKDNINITELFIKIMRDILETCLSLSKSHLFPTKRIGI